MFRASSQQSLQPKLSRRRYGDVSYALQNRSVFKRVQNCVSVNVGSRTVSGSEFHRLGLWCTWPGDQERPFVSCVTAAWMAQPRGRGRGPCPQSLTESFFLRKKLLKCSVGCPRAPTKKGRQLFEKKVHRRSFCG